LIVGNWLNLPAMRGLLLVWAGILVLTFAGRLFTTDVAAELEVSGSLIGARPFLSAEHGWTVQGSGSAKYVPHGIGYSLLLLPAALIDTLAGSEAGKLAAAGLNSLFSLLLVAVWYLLARRWISTARALRLVALGISGMLVVYARMPYDITAATAAALAGVFLMTRDKPLQAGLCLGLALLIRLDTIVLLPAFWPGMSERRKLLKLAYGVAPFLLLAAAANWFRFGSPFADGHAQDPAMAFSPLSGGLAGLLFSPGKGLIWYSPICVLAFFCNRDVRLWLPFVLSLILHGMVHDWTGGTGWGPRFLVPTLPLLLLPLTAAGKGGRLFWILAGIGMALLAVSAWSNTNALEQNLGPDLFDEPARQSVLWSVSRSPLISSFASFGRWPPELFGVHAATAAGLPAWIGFMCQMIAGGVLVLLGWRHIAEKGIIPGQRVSG